MVAEASFLSKDGLWIKLTVEDRTPKILGRDFVSGGSRDFLGTTRSGFRLIAKGHRNADPKKLTASIRAAILELVGNPPAFLPASYLSGLIEFGWEGGPVTSEEAILSHLREKLEATELGKAILSKALRRWWRERPVKWKEPLSFGRERFGGESEKVRENTEEYRSKSKSLNVHSCPGHLLQ